MYMNQTSPHQKKYALAAVALVAVAVLAVAYKRHQTGTVIKDTYEYSARDGQVVTTHEKKVDGKTVASTKTATPKPMPVIGQVMLQAPLDANPVPVQLPYQRSGGDNEILNFSIGVNYAAGQTGTFQITPDDCVEALTVNNTAVKLTGDALANRCNWSQGFRIDLQPYLADGDNSIFINVRNMGGPTGLNIVPVQ